MTLCWEDNLEELHSDTESSRAGLIYNIAHATRELLLEASEMVRLMDGHRMPTTGNSQDN